MVEGQEPGLDQNRLVEVTLDPNSIGHDGALVLERGKVLTFGSRLPLSKDASKTAQLGTRHTAALGLAELTDALAIVVGGNPTVNQIRDAINGVYSGSGIPGLTGATASVNAAGNLVITADNAANGIGINERTSQEATTGFGFSHYFGLNDLFIGDATISLASSIKVRADIVADPGLLSRGELSAGTLTNGTRAIAVGNNAVAKRMADKFTQDLTFAAVGGLPQTTTNISGYGATILASNANLAAQTKDVLEFRDILFKDTKSKADAFSGVNVDEELSNMILFQNAYSASARMISALDEMLRTLIDMV